MLQVGRAPSGGHIAKGRLLFVYGSLRRGGDAEPRGLGVQWLGRARTQPIYTLYDLGQWPGLVFGGHTSVVGDLLLVGRAQLAKLDIYEECPRVFARVPIALHGHREVDGYVLVARPRLACVRRGGDWLARSARAF